MIRCEPAQIKHHAQGPVPVDIDICLADFFLDAAIICSISAGEISLSILASS